MGRAQKKSHSLRSVARVLAKQQGDVVARSDRRCRKENQQVNSSKPWRGAVRVS
jgi:hypothetical protein